MKTEFLEVSEAILRGKQLPWAMVRSLSSVTLGNTPEKIDEDELLEARFFSDTKEVRIFRQDDRLRAVSLEQEAADSLVTETYSIQNRIFGKEIQVSHVLDADCDGQTYITATRLVGWKEV